MDHVTIGLSEEIQSEIPPVTRPRGVSKPAFSIHDLKVLLIASRGRSTSRIEDLSSWAKGRVAVARRHVFRSVPMGDHPVVALLDFLRHPIYNLNCLVLLGNW